MHPLQQATSSNFPSTFLNLPVAGINLLGIYSVKAKNMEKVRKTRTFSMFRQNIFLQKH